MKHHQGSHCYPKVAEGWDQNHHAEPGRAALLAVAGVSTQPQSHQLHLLTHSQLEREERPEPLRAGMSPEPQSRKRARGEGLIPTYKPPSPGRPDTPIPREDFGVSFSHPPHQSRHFAAEPSPGLPGHGQTSCTKPGVAHQGGKPFPMSNVSTDTEAGHPICPGSSLPPASSPGVTPPSCAFAAQG